jgi:hypothetical protein
MNRKQISKKASTTIGTTCNIKEDVPGVSYYGSLSSVVQRMQQDPNSVIGDERQQLESAIGSRSMREILAAKQTQWVPEFQGISAKLWGDAGQVDAPIQAKGKDDFGVSDVQSENKTGLPDDLKAGVENLSGYSLDDVRVRYNSPKPAEVQALAYTQGAEINVAPGQEKHLPHEAWHVVQQMQCRVKPTMRMKGKVNINDDAGLEHEADVMGAKALSSNTMSHVPHSKNLKGTSGNIDSGDAPLQGRFGFEIEVPIFFTKAVNGQPNMRRDPGSNTHIDQGSFEVHVDHNEELRALSSYANVNQNGNWDGFAGGPSITEIVTKPWDEFALSEQDMKDRAANIRHWVEAIYALASQGEANLAQDYYVGSNSPKRTLQNTVGYFQTTYGIKLSKTPDLFKQSGKAAKRNDPGERENFANQLIKAGEVGKAVVKSLKGYSIESGWFKDKVSSQATEDELNILAGYTALLANYIYADVAMINGIGLGKNLIGDYFYKTNLGSLSNALPDSIKNLLRNNARVRTNYITLLSSKCDRMANDDMLVGMTISDWVTQVINGGDDVFLNALKNPYSNELASEEIGPVGSREAGVVMENREPQNLDPATRQKRRDMNQEKIAFFGGGRRSQEELADFLRDMTDPKKYSIDQWENVMLKIYHLLREING